MAVADNPDRAGGAQDIEALCEALLTLKTPDEMRRFLRDLTTPGELQALAERWRVARMLDEGGKSYRDISAQTGVSTTTVTRVARFLSQEDHRGYRLVLDRTRETSS
ncbi:TrpR like protein, YerC/YecD [Alkalicaulis satelles]|uniref:TrpR like protein, YerC/YecD n=1 Tax=Alkalicaulis satelles TaxID=2609175 RepID=A0A5M6ZR55_9PROT|nr:YerC/YecD family TrpR-related protein [Alkalicaulis satelles]KAA5804761.1 TrpR like protein, YerC/YecD [Alkalicaulis satelles]